MGVWDLGCRAIRRGLRRSTGRGPERINTFCFGGRQEVAANYLPGESAMKDGVVKSVEVGVGCVAESAGSRPCVAGKVRTD
jgi:hypothetical protein